MARILIVDDSPTETFRFREILTKHGYEGLEATNGQEYTSCGTPTVSANLEMTGFKRLMMNSF